MNDTIQLKAMFIAFFATSLLLLSACGGGKTSPSVPQTPTTEAPLIIPPPETDPGSNPSTKLSLIHTQGRKWHDADGNEVILRGVNIGNWLLQEFWMMGQSTPLVNDQCTLESILTNRFGAAEKKRLMKLFRDNWITERDWDLLESFEFNVIRLPFIYHLIEDDTKPYHLREDAWEYLDAAISAAEDRNMYVILDLHGVVGSQWDQHTTGCEGQNEYWGNPDYRNRTTWLWEQIATRYKDNNTVAAYGLLNEPWGTDAINLSAVMTDLYTTVRAVDPNHTIILPGHNSGIAAYGSPAQQGISNSAFEMHFYPGFFGWGNIGYDVHHEWLTCGSNGVSGVCEWEAQLDELDAAFIVGEFQPWAGLGQLGGDITRATFDTYAGLGWAATAWSYKYVSNSGGEGEGTWGLVTNKGNSFDEKLVAANTWNCAGWDSSFADACLESTTTFTSSDDVTIYLVVKAGSFSDLDVTIDEISLVQNSNAQEIILNGGFGSGANWNEFTVDGSPFFNFTNDLDTPSGAAGQTLRITGQTSNGGIYQPISLQAGHSYTLSGVFKDNGSIDAWAEVYLVPDEPINGIDVLSTQVVPTLDFSQASLEEIEALFRSFSTMDYDVHESVKSALLAALPTNILTLK